MKPSISDVHAMPLGLVLPPGFLPANAVELSMVRAAASCRVEACGLLLVVLLILVLGPLGAT